MSLTIPVCEMFESIQGEGRFAGRHAFFVRTAGCNLDCTWCDTPYSLRAEDGEPQAVERVAEIVAASRARHLVVTGGEPLLHRQAIGALADALPKLAIEFETNGTIAPTIERAYYSVSPKPSSAGNDPERAVRMDVLREFLAYDAVFKFVVGDDNDWRDMMDAIERAGIPSERVWVMPRGRQDAELRATALSLMPRILDHKFNLSPRLHVWLWGDERGK